MTGADHRDGQPTFGLGVLVVLGAAVLVLIAAISLVPRLAQTQTANLDWQQVGADFDATQRNIELGTSVAVSADDSRIAIGAPQYSSTTAQVVGQVRVYDFNGSSWEQVGQALDGEQAFDQSGDQLSISADGARVAIGAVLNDGNGRNSGHVRIYELDGSEWMQLGQDLNGEAERDVSGFSVSFNADGTRVAVGARMNDGNGENSGHTRVYELRDSQWFRLGLDIDGESAGDESGFSVSLSADGSRVAVGARTQTGVNGVSSGSVPVFDFDSDVGWVQVGPSLDGESATDRSGSSVSLSADGSRVAIGAPGNHVNGEDSRHVRVFSVDDGAQIGSDIDGKNTLDRFGSSVSLSADGTSVAIGAPLDPPLGVSEDDPNFSESNYVRVLQFDGTDWQQVGTEITGVPNTRFGSSVATSADGSRVVIGAPAAFDTGQARSGQVRVLSSARPLMPSVTMFPC